MCHNRSLCILPGYIGGSVLQRILNHPRASAFDITVLVRDTRKAKLLETKFGLTVVEGSLDDIDKLTELAENAHIVIHAVRVAALLLLRKIAELPVHHRPTATMNPL